MKRRRKNRGRSKWYKGFYNPKYRKVTDYYESGNEVYSVNVNLNQMSRKTIRSALNKKGKGSVKTVNQWSQSHFKSAKQADKPEYRKMHFQLAYRLKAIADSKVRKAKNRKFRRKRK